MLVAQDPPKSSGRGLRSTKTPTEPGDAMATPARRDFDAKNGTEIAFPRQRSMQREGKQALSIATRASCGGSQADNRESISPSVAKYTLGSREGRFFGGSGGASSNSRALSTPPIYPLPNGRTPLAVGAESLQQRVGKSLERRGSMNAPYIYSAQLGRCCLWRRWREYRPKRITVRRSGSSCCLHQGGK